jgi:hypothetical protein
LSVVAAAAEDLDLMDGMVEEAEQELYQKAL